MYFRYGFALAMNVMMGNAIAKICEPEVPVQCDNKPVAQWIAEQKALRCIPNPGVPGGETIEKCEEEIPHQGYYCALDVIARDSTGSRYSKGTAVWANCPQDVPNPGLWTLNTQTFTCVQQCPAPVDLPIDDEPLTCKKTGDSPLGEQDGGKPGNPMVPALGEKIQVETDIALPGPHGFEAKRIYRSSRAGGGLPMHQEIGAPAVSVYAGISYASGGASSGGGSGSRRASVTSFPEPEIPLMGVGWNSNAFGRIRINPSLVQGANSIHLGWAFVSLPNGGYRAFKPTGQGLWSPAEQQTADRLVERIHNNGSVVYREFAYKPADSDNEYIFFISVNSDPQTGTSSALSEIRSANSWVLRFVRDNPTQELSPLRRVVNAFNQVLEFEYTAAQQISQITRLNPAGQQVDHVGYTYDNLKRLTSITYSDGTEQQLHYELTAKPFLLTGYSRNNLRISTYQYDQSGKIIATSKTNGVDRFAVDYSSSTTSNYERINDKALITDPLGTVREYQYSGAGQRLNVTRADKHAPSVSTPPIRLRAINYYGFVETEAEFEGLNIDYAYDTDRHLATSISKGGGTKLQTIQWHPTFRLPTQIDETDGKRTVNTYDERGNLTEQTVTATSGPTTSQTWRWAYNANNLLTSETDPRGSTTTHTYNSAGQRTQSTNALGHVTTYGFDAAGRLNRITQPDGLVQTMAYTPRGWLSQSTLTAGAGTNAQALTTRYTYAPSGQVTQLRLPNGHVIDYRYDAAERLIGWTDNRSQRADYTLDPMGNITQELVRNSSGHVALEIRRVINSLNRVQSETRGPSIVEHYTQDANGRLASIRDAANGTTTLTRDALARITAITDPASRTARLSYNAQDAVTSAVDFKTVTTTYTRDVLGNARSEATPDAGTAQSTYDALGLPTQVVDALGRATAITRDALGRPTSFTHSGTGLATLVTDLRYDLPGDACNAPGHASASRGRLCEMTDSTNGVPQVTTRYQWDAFGRLTRQTQTISSAIADHSQVRSVAYAYAASSAGVGAGVGELQSITYPSGSVLTHQHDATGRLTGLLWNGAPLLRNLTHNALGQPLGWTWALNATAGGTAPEGSTLAALRSYNTAGELTSTEFSQYTPDGRGLITALNQGLYRSDGSGAWALESVPHSVQYDPTGRITSFGSNGSTNTFQRAQTFTFDANGNRTSDTISTAGTSPVSYTHDMAGDSNQQTTFAGINITTNAAGDITSLAGRTMAYDSAGRLHQATHTPACPSGSNCLGPQTTTSHHNGHGQRFLRTTAQGQSVYLYGTDQYTVLAETHQASALTTSSTEHIYLPTASGPMPVIAIIDGQRFAVHSDHLNTPRRLTDASNRPRWQWAYSAFGDLAAQSLPAAGLSTVSYALRYPGQVDDGNGLFYNFNRFYDPRVGRYTQADPLGVLPSVSEFASMSSQLSPRLREKLIRKMMRLNHPYAYVDSNPFSYIDPDGLETITLERLGSGALRGGLTGGMRGGVLGAGLGLGLGIAAEMCSPTDRDREERQCDADYDAGQKFCHAMATTKGRHAGTKKYAKTYSQCMQAVDEAYVECYQNAGK